MKTNAIIRIVLYSLAVFLLLGILGLSLAVHQFSLQNVFQETDAPAASGGCNADPAKVRNIEIDWASGSIRIEPSDQVMEIQVRETAAEEKYRMVCRTSGNTLSVEYSENETRFPGFGIGSESKNLVITVPADWVCNGLDIEVASGDVYINNMIIGTMEFDGASGECIMENCRIGNLDMDTASGDITFSGVLGTLDFDGASADCTLKLTECPTKICMDGMSGNLDITLPSDCGFTAVTEGLSCVFSTDFQTVTQGTGHIHGDGKCRIELNALSGSVAIHDGRYSCHDNDNKHHSGHH